MSVTLDVNNCVAVKYIHNAVDIQHQGVTGLHQGKQLKANLLKRYRRKPSIDGQTTGPALLPDRSDWKDQMARGSELDFVCQQDPTNNTILDLPANRIKLWKAQDSNILLPHITVQLTRGNGTESARDDSLLVNWS
jgi:hypothetical protein